MNFSMSKSISLFLSLFIIAASIVRIEAQGGDDDKSYPTAATFRPSPVLQKILDDAVNRTLKKYEAKNLRREDIAATLIDLRDAKYLSSASVRGDRKIYPASVVKLFFLAAAHQWLEDKTIKSSTPELERGLRDMIVDSSNDATHYVLDVLTDTSSGGELSPNDLKIFGEKRNLVNRYFTRLGYTNINVNQKTYCEDAYGRERQFRFDGTNRNMLTTDSTARLLAEIAHGRSVSPERSRMMRDLLKRDFVASKDENDQARGFTGIALNEMNLKDAKLWSKAGWTSKTRHDAAYVELADGRKFVLVVFTENFANERGIIPSIAAEVLKNLN